MKTQIHIHPVQVKILRALLFKKEARFSELNIENLTNDHFTFHINELIRTKLIIKNNNSLYELSQDGKEFANRLDTDNLEIERQAKLAVIVICIKKINGQKVYLCQQRLKNPFYGFHGFITGKIRWGESPSDTARRELLEETNLKGTVKLCGIEHKKDYNVNNKLLEDKYFFIFKATDLEGELTPDIEGGKNIWVTKEKLLSLPDLFNDVEDVINLLDNSELTFTQKEFVTKKY